MPWPADGCGVAGGSTGHALADGRVKKRFKDTAATLGVHEARLELPATTGYEKGRASGTSLVVGEQVGYGP
jgi:hypothetical protein